MTQGIIASSSHRVVFGLGATGVSCARHLYRRGLPFTVVDTRAQAPGLSTIQQEMPDVPVYCGAVPVEVVTEASQLIVSPGVSLQDDLVRQAAAAGAEITGDIDLFVAEARAPIVGITGSNAKSTVTALVGAMAEAAGVNVAVGGNLGTPALDLLDDKHELYVLELSSFQLERSAALNLQTAVVLNISEDHLDRHGDMPTYHLAKHRIFQGARQVVVNTEDPLTVPLVPPSVRVINWRMGVPGLQGFGLSEQEGEETICRGFDPLMPVAELALVGRHNVANALAALAIGASVELPMASMVKTLREFSGLPHRCEKVATNSGVDYINDSKGTNVGATLAALHGLGGDRDIVLIAGGEGKGADFTALKSAVAAHCRLVLLIGEAASQIESALEGCVAISHAATMQQAVVVAAEHARPGDCVLMSPACASFDMFDNYRQRGDVFTAAAQALQGGAL